MTSSRKEQKLSLCDSLFGSGRKGGGGDGNGLFSRSVKDDRAPTKRARRGSTKKKNPTDTNNAPLTPQELWKQRQKQYNKNKEEINHWELIYDPRIPEDVFAEDVRSTCHTYGLAVVRKALDPKVLERLQVCANQQRTQLCQALEKRNLTYNDETNNVDPVCFQEVVVRCKGRMDARYRKSDTDDDTVNFWHDHTLLQQTIGALLYGEEHMPKLVYAGWIFSFPGSDNQPWHQDGIPLYPGNTVTPNLPPYAINVFIPLNSADGSLQAGPTEFVVGSHRQTVQHAMQATKDPNSPSLACPVLEQGDFLLYDYRICHRGTANLTHVVEENNPGRVRSILYLMYSRPWFHEHLNFGTVKLLQDTSCESRTEE